MHFVFLNQLVNISINLSVILLLKLINMTQLQNKPEMMIFIWIDPRVVSGEYQNIISRGLPMMVLIEY